MWINKVDMMAKVRNYFVPGQTMEELITMGYEGILKKTKANFADESLWHMPPEAVMELIAMEILISARVVINKPPSASKV